VAGDGIDKLRARLGNCAVVIGLGLALFGVGVAAQLGAIQIVGVLVVVAGMCALLIALLTGGRV
jgi:hypothetical protein